MTTETLRQLAIDRLGCVDARVTSYVAKHKCSCLDMDTDQVDDMNVGHWFVLSVKPRPGAAFGIVARRRTLNELTQFVKQRRKPAGCRAVA